MKKALFWLTLSLLCLLSIDSSAKPAQLEPRDVNAKVNELLFTHISQKKLSPEILKRALDNLVHELDSLKCYLLKEEVETYLNPSDDFLNKALEDFYKSQFTAFEEPFKKMVQAIDRRAKIEQKIAKATLLESVHTKDMQDMDWCDNERELYDRLLKIRSFQNNMAEKIKDADFKSKFLKIVDKRRKWREEEIIGKNAKEQKQIFHSYILKAIASALDSQTVYFPPEEARLFMMQVQQRLLGIGVQLVDDLTGFKIVSLIDDGPAKVQGGLKEKDLIVAVDDEYVVGMDINQAVQLIRGKEHTKVKLTVLRQDTESSDEPIKHEVTITRGEVVIEESRIEASLEPFADGHIAHLTLHSFYQDPKSSCAQDLHNKLSELHKNYKLKGVILDLRNNTGGILPQAVAVNSLFMGKGIVVSIKNYDGTIHHLRNVESNPIWDGPLVVLLNKLSASAAEIVAQSLQDYGRAIVVGDERSFGKGTFQLPSQNFYTDRIDPQGEYKVTQGMYYTVSGKSPQLVGVQSDIIVPSYLAEAEVGESFSKYPVENDHITSNFEDRLDDIPAHQLEKVKRYYHFDLQPKLTDYTKHLSVLKNNSKARIENNKDYKQLLEYLKNNQQEDPEYKETENDHQLLEAMNIMKDLIYLYESDQFFFSKVS